MIPIALHLDNFMSYRTPTAVDFSDIRIACLSGDNGAGKSALLEAMTWAIWGKSRATSDRDVISTGASQMEVTFDFRLADRDYRVFRRRTSGGRAATVEFFIRDAGATDWLSISGDSVRETNRKISSTLRMDYETFVNSAFLMQGQADTFTEKSPGERKKVLADILNLGDYDILNTMAREQERTLRGKASHTHQLVARLDEQLGKRPDVEAQLQILSASLVQSSERVEEVDRLVTTQQDQLNALGSLVRSRDATTVRLNRMRSRVTEIENLVMDDRAALARVNALVKRGEDIDRGYSELVKWRRAADAWAAVLRRRQPLEERLRDAERQFERARNDAQRRLDRHVADEKQARVTLAHLDSRTTELASLKEAATNDQDTARKLSGARDDLRKHETERATLEAECAALKIQMNDIKKNMELLATGDAECPICRRPISEGEHEHVSSLWTAEGTRLGDLFREYRHRIKTIDAKVKELTGDVKSLERAAIAATERAAVIGRIESEISGRKQFEEDVATAEREIARLGSEIQSNAFAPELLRVITETSAALKKLAYDTGKAADADEQIKRLAGYEKDHQELQTARIQFANLQQTISERELAIKESRAETEALEQELRDIQLALEGEPELREKLRTNRDELERLQAERDDLQSRFGAVQNQMQHLDRLADEQERHKADLEALGLDADTYKELVVAFGRNGIQAMIVETILPELEDETNRLLSRMANSQLHVDFRSTRQAMSNENIIETLDIIIRDELGERPYALYSGGESFRVDFAIRVALSKLLVKRVGATIDMLIIDEGFGTQDIRGREGLIEALQSVESDFETILVITHIDEVRDMFPTRIEVTKTDAGSQVAVI